MSARGKNSERDMSPRELRIAIAALFRAGFSIAHIAWILGQTEISVEIELREYLLEKRP